MKKFGIAVLGFFAAVLLAGCNSGLNGDQSVEYGSLTMNLASDSRYLDVSEISKATVNVWYNKSEKVSKTDVSVSAGKGSVTIENIPAGSNRVVEVIGYKATGVEGKRLYYVTTINGGNNVISSIKDGAESAKGKAYLALLNAGVSVSGVSLDGFDAEKSAYYFDADSFAQAYKANSSVSPSSYYTAAKTVTLSSIVNAAGYTVWIGDPLSEKYEIQTDDIKSISIENVAVGTWNVYVDDGDSSGSAKNVGTVEVSSTSAIFDTTIGNLLKGKTVIFAKTTYSNIYVWYDGSETALNGSWPGAAFTSSDCSLYMNDATGWKMADITSSYNSNLGTIDFIITNSDGGKEYNDDLKSGKSATFWFDGESYYDSDPTEGKLSSDATLASISVNGTALTGFASGTTSYSISVATSVTSATVTAVANYSAATVVVSPSGSTDLTEGVAKVFTITVTAEDGTTTKTYTVNVTRATANDTTLSSITVNGKSATISGTTATANIKGSEGSLSITSIEATAVDSSATVTYSATTGTVADGASKSFTITVTNGSKTATYTLTVSYTMKDPTSGQYGTNDKGYGVNATISSWSDWTEDMQIARGAAYDDPRTWMGIQETAYDAYALYAAYDDTNLYLMVELTNLPDGRATFMNHNYAGSDNAWWDNRDCPLGFIINTGKGSTATAPLVGSASGKPIWDAINFTDSEGFDFLFYGSSKYGYADHKAAFVGVGTPGFFKLNPSTGYFSYDDEYCMSANSGAPGNETAGTSGISVRYIRQCQVSSTVNFESTPTDNRATSEQTGEDLMESETYTSVETNDLDMSYWYTIPLATLGIDKAYIQSTGIGVRQLTPNGGSLMDCLPWDVSMVDNATEPCSDDESTSHEKEDTDTITSAQARVGK